MGAVIRDPNWPWAAWASSSMTVTPEALPAPLLPPPSALPLVLGMPASAAASEEEESAALEGGEEAERAAAARTSVEVVRASMVRQGQVGWETLISYGTIAYAMFNIQFINDGVPFFRVVVLLAVVFFLVAWLKAYAEVLLAARRSPAAHGMGFLAVAVRVADAFLAFLIFELVQIVLVRAAPYISDGHWQLRNLVLPVLLLAYGYGEWHYAETRASVQALRGPDSSSS